MLYSLNLKGKETRSSLILWLSCWPCKCFMCGASVKWCMSGH